MRSVIGRADMARLCRDLPGLAMASLCLININDLVE